MELAQTERSGTAQTAGPSQSRQSVNVGNTERIECLYDLRAVFEDGRSETAHRVNVCETQTWDYRATPSA